LALSHVLGLLPPNMVMLTTTWNQNGTLHSKYLGCDPKNDKPSMANPTAGAMIVVLLLMNATGTLWNSALFSMKFI